MTPRIPGDPPPNDGEQEVDPDPVMRVLSLPFMLIAFALCIYLYGSILP